MPTATPSAFAQPFKALIDLLRTPASPHQTSTPTTIQGIWNGPSLFSPSGRGRDTRGGEAGNAGGSSRINQVMASESLAADRPSLVFVGRHDDRGQMRPTDWVKIHKHTRALCLIALVRVRAGHERHSSAYKDATELLRDEAWGIANRRGHMKLDLWEKVGKNAAGNHRDPAWAALELERCKVGPMAMPFSSKVSNAELGRDILAGTLSARLMEVGSLPAQPPCSSTTRGTPPETSEIRSLARSASGALVDELVERIAEADTVKQMRAELAKFVRMFERGGQALPSGRLPVLDLVREQIEFCNTFDVKQAGAMMRMAIADHQRELSGTAALSHRDWRGDMPLA